MRDVCSLSPIAKVHHFILFSSTASAFIGLLFATPQAHAIPFSFSAESFQITGNLSQNAIDEFDDGVIAPWTTEGTVTEANGVVTFEDPGLEFVGERNGVAVTQQTSRIRLEPMPQDPFYVSDGNGDFVATSRWSPLLPSINQSYFLQLTQHDLSSSGKESFSVGVTGGNDPALAQAFGVAPNPPGVVAISFNVIQDGNPGQVDNQFVVIDPADITGSIFLQLNYDDINDTINAEYSLDGGVNFYSPFSAAASSYAGNSTNTWDLGVDDFEAQVVPEPASLALLGFGLIGLGVVNRRRSKL